MSFTLKDGEALGAGLERVIRKQHKKLRSECDRASDDAAAFVHKARVRCKRIRAALRLAQPVIGDKAYRRNNRWWRDAAGGLSALRDLTARDEALTALRADLEQQAGAASVFRLEAQFARDLATAARVGDSGAAIAEFSARVRKRNRFSIANGHDRDEDDADGEQLVEGLARSYREARRAMGEALADPTPEKLHEWRKQTKYHALQLRLGRKVFPELAPLIKETRNLAEKLGLLQDIEVLRLALAEGSDDRLLLALELRRRDLRVAARIQGERLFAMKRAKWSDTMLQGATA